jgi:hypothetical protein
MPTIGLALTTVVLVILAMWFFTKAALRLRHAYGKIETDVIDVLFGQYYNLFGWQPNFFPATLSFLGTPNMIFGRTPQIRLSKTIKTDPINVEIAGAATRPPQRDASFPGLEGASGSTQSFAAHAALPLQTSRAVGRRGRASGASASSRFRTTAATSPGIDLPRRPPSPFR